MVTPAPPVVNRGATILAVDNAPTNLELLRSTFEPFGYSVVTAASLQAALALARQSPPDLILSDLYMPDGDGFAFIQKVKADPRLKPIPFLFLSSTTPHGPEYQRGLTLGADEFILRPIEPQALLKKVEAYLKK